MHQLLVLLFGFVLSFGHHTAGRSLQAQNAFQPSEPSPALFFPERQDLAHASAAGSYADAGCLSCRQMNVSYIAR